MNCINQRQVHHNIQGPSNILGLSFEQGFNIQLVVTGSWFHFQRQLDLIGGEACEVAGNKFVTIGNEESCP